MRQDESAGEGIIVDQAGQPQNTLAGAVSQSGALNANRISFYPASPTR